MLGVPCLLGEIFGVTAGAQKPVAESIEWRGVGSDKAGKSGQVATLCAPHEFGSV